MSQLTSQLLFKKAKTVRQSCPLSSTAFNIKWSSNFEYLRCGALRLLGWSLARPFLLLIDICGASENGAAPETFAQVLVRGLERLVVTGISVAPLNAALRKMLSQKLPHRCEYDWEATNFRLIYVSKKRTFPFAFDGVYCFAFDLLHVWFFILSFAHRCQSSWFSEKHSLAWYSPSFEVCNLWPLSRVWKRTPRRKKA